MTAEVKKFVVVEKNENRSFVEENVRSVLNVHFDKDENDVEGFAFIIWGKDLRSTCISLTKAEKIPAILVPEFVKSRLLAEKILEWVREEKEEENSPEPKKPGA